MPWAVLHAGSRIWNFARASLLTSSGIAIIASGAWIMYQDTTRWPRMEMTFATGNIVPPMDEDMSEMAYFERAEVEDCLRHVLTPHQTGRYHVIRGDIGSGKSRMIQRCVKEMMKTEGLLKRGAPVYVAAGQSCTFVDALAAGVNFHFDEHINFIHFVNFVFKVNIRQEGHDRLARVLSAIEEAGRRYAAKAGRPAVLVIDGVDYLAEHDPKCLTRLQDKAKFWADAGIAKVVLVSSHDETGQLLRGNRCGWSRADTPLYIGDLPRDAALELLQSDLTRDGSGRGVFDVDTAERVYTLVGGRVQDLLAFKRDRALGWRPNDTAMALIIKERDKLPLLPPMAVDALHKMVESEDKHLPLEGAGEGVQVLLQRGILRLERRECVMTVIFASRLAENTAHEYVTRYKLSL